VLKKIITLAHLDYKNLIKTFEIYLIYERVKFLGNKESSVVASPQKEGLYLGVRFMLNQP
jgi:hypothetical protein